MKGGQPVAGFSWLNGKMKSWGIEDGACLKI